MSFYSGIQTCWILFWYKTGHISSGMTVGKQWMTGLVSKAESSWVSYTGPFISDMGGFKPFYQNSLGQGDGSWNLPLGKDRVLNILIHILSKLILKHHGRPLHLDWHLQFFFLRFQHLQKLSSPVDYICWQFKIKLLYLCFKCVQWNMTAKSDLLPTITHT